MGRFKIKVVTFDLDDTLYDERIFFLSGLKAVAEYISRKDHIDYQTVYRHLQRLYKKRGREFVFDNYLKEKGLFTTNNKKRLIQVYRNHTPSINLNKRMKNYLLSLKKKYKLAIITDGVKIAQRNKIQALRLNDIFDLIVVNSKAKAKPNTWSFQKTVNYFKVRPQEIIYIGDDPAKDFYGAKKIGIKTVRIMQGKHKRVLTPGEFEADYKVNNIDEAIKLISNQI